MDSQKKGPLLLETPIAGTPLLTFGAKSSTRHFRTPNGSPAQVHDAVDDDEDAHNGFDVPHSDLYPTFGCYTGAYQIWMMILALAGIAHDCFEGFALKHPRKDR